MPRAKLRERVCQWCDKVYLLGLDSTQHKYCSVECRKKWHAKKWLTSERTKRDPTKSKDYRLKRSFGISLEDHDNMLALQGGRCGICGIGEPMGYNWHVDHCHKTNRVRGILCQMCNQALGMIKDDTNTLRNMIKYLELHENRVN